MRPRRRQQRLVRAVVYVLVLLVVIGMILTMVGSALAAAVPTASVSDTASSSRPAPVVVLGTSNLTWADLRSQVSGGGDPRARLLRVLGQVGHGGAQGPQRLAGLRQRLMHDDGGGHLDKIGRAHV